MLAWVCSPNYLTSLEGRGVNCRRPGRVDAVDDADGTVANGSLRRRRWNIVRSARHRRHRARQERACVGFSKTWKVSPPPKGTATSEPVLPKLSVALVVTVAPGISARTL